MGLIIDPTKKQQNEEVFQEILQQIVQLHVSLLFLQTKSMLLQMIHTK